MIVERESIKPIIKHVGQNSIMKAQYGQLDKDNWKEDISNGFGENRCTEEEAKKYPQFKWVALEELK